MKIGGAPSVSRRPGELLVGALLFLLVFLALLVLPSCTGTAQWDITPPPEGTWPFDRFGNYHEAYADGRHPDADLFHQQAAFGIDILDLSLRGPQVPAATHAGRHVYVIPVRQIDRHISRTRGNR